MDEWELKAVIEEHTEEALQARLKEREVEHKIKQWMNGEEIVVLTGVRRSGKSSIMFRLLQQYGGAYINFEDERLMDFTIKDFEKLAHITEGPLYLDEVQHVKGWERFARRIHRKRKVVVSGSNSSLFQGEYATSLTGRTITFRIKPLNYREFLHFKGLKANKQSFLKYLELGGFPAVVLRERRELLREYFQAILYKDIRGVNERLIRLAHYLLSNIGKPFTYRSLKGFLGVKHEITVKNYLRRLQDAYLLDIIYKYDPSLKKMESYEKKPYAVDHGLASLFPRREDRGRLLENAVYINLEGNIYFYKNRGEVDFLIGEGLKIRVALNVTYELNPQNLKKELEPLKHWPNSYLLYLYSEIEDVGMPVYAYLFKHSRSI